MSPENANICIIDDTPWYITGLKKVFENSDHKVLLTTSTKDEALELVDRFEQNEIDIVLLDTKLVPGDEEGRESGEILKKILKVAPNVKVITMSSGHPLEGGDVKITKLFSRRQIIDTVTNI